MWHLYLDESGDLGFDFVNKKPSRHFTLAIVVAQGDDANRRLSIAVRRTISRKLKAARKKNRDVLELKASSTTIGVKQYFFRQLRNVPIDVYAFTLNKRRVYDQLTREKDRVYNYLARQVLDRIPFEKANDRIQLTLDRSKSKMAITDFDQYIARQLQGRIDPKIPLNINHLLSHNVPGLQAADFFAWGIFRKYERADEEWYGVFKDRVRFDDLYLK